MSAGRNVTLLLSDSLNEYQQLVRSDVLEVANRLGLTVEVHFADNSAPAQARQFHDIIRRPTPPAAIMMVPVRDSTLSRLASDAAAKGIGLVFLNRWIDEIKSLRQAFPSLPIFSVTPDHRDIGRIQGRQIMAAAPGDGKILYVHGKIENYSAAERLGGMREVISGTGVELHLLDGDWSVQGSQRVVTGWLRIVMRGDFKLDLIACQNDQMAIGAAQALEAVAVSLGSDEIRRVPVTGCNGLAANGKKLVDEGKLLATVIVPPSGGPALKLIERALNAGEIPPERVVLQSTSYPAEEVLARRRTRTK